MKPISLRRKLMLVLLGTTAAALALSAVALLIYELRLYRTTWISDLETQADLIAYASGPALAFDDVKVAQQNLQALRVHPLIDAAALYRADGRLFAGYVRGAADPASQLPAKAPAAAGHRFEGRDLELLARVETGGERVGTVYLRARYHVLERLQDYLLILAGVMLASLALAALIFQRLQHAVTAPILAVAGAARQVIEQRDYSQQVPKTTADEVGVLVDAFNAMLAEVGRRTDALESADRRKDEFLATLAHELRNPLAPMVNALELLKRADLDASARQRALDIIERQLRQMVRLIDDLLEVSRISTGKLVLRSAPVDLVAVVRSAIETSEPALQQRSHRLDRHWPDEPVWVDGDATRLAQVFANLLHNAAKYTDPGGRIRIDVEPAADEVAVHVSDNGIGIEPALQHAIFDMFSQVDKTLERGRAGLGVGLTLSRQLAALHGGSVSVHSAGLGHGSRFTVRLPRRAAPADALAPTVAATAPGRPAGPLRVLVADDNIDFANSLGAMLQAAGHDVRVMHDGRAALDAALLDPPQVGLFDIGMPGLNGYDLARRLREHAATRGMLLVAISGWGQRSDRERSRDAGFDRHLIKPVAWADLLDVLAGGPRPAEPAALAER